jgi:four helix bundle protein
LRLSSDSAKDVRFRSRQFGLRIIRMAAKLPRDMAAQIIARQIIRSATSVGAHLAEANRARSVADFISKIDGALQELEESRYWMDMIADAGFLEKKKLSLLMKESDELMAMMSAMANKSRRFEKSAGAARR